MNYIIILLASLSVFAQYKVEVKNLNGELTHGAEFETQELAQAWISEQENDGSWGKLERVIPKAQASDEELNEMLLEEIPAEFEGFGDDGLPLEVEPVKVKLKRTFSVEIKDISEEIAAQKEKENRKKLARERFEKFDMSKLDNATTILGLKAAVRDLLTELQTALK